jgi:hypothetical protein
MITYIGSAGRSNKSLGVGRSRARKSCISNMSIRHERGCVLPVYYGYRILLCTSRCTYRKENERIRNAWTTMSHVHGFMDCDMPRIVKYTQYRAYLCMGRTKINNLKAILHFVSRLMNGKKLGIFLVYNSEIKYHSFVPE